MLSATQMYDWEIYSRVEPFGQQRSDLMTAIGAAAAVNLWVKEGQSVHPYDFIPGMEKPEPTDAEMAAACIGFAESMRAGDGRQSKNRKP